MNPLSTDMCLNNTIYSNIGEGSTSQATNITQDGDDIMLFFSPCSILDELDLSRSVSPYCSMSRASRSTSLQMAKRACKQKRASKEDETNAALLHTLYALAAMPNKEKEVNLQTHLCMDIAPCLRRLPPRQNA